MLKSSSVKYFTIASDQTAHPEVLFFRKIFIKKPKYVAFI